MATATTGRRTGELTTRDQLLRAVITIAGEQGQHAVTYRSVAARADVAHGLVRHYFGTRQAMLAEAFELAIGEDIAEVVLATDNPDEFGRGLFTTEDEAWHRRLLQFDVTLSAARGSTDRQLVEHLYQRYFAAVRQTLRALDVDDPDDAWTTLLFAALDGLVLQQSLFRDSDHTEAVLLRLREMLRWLSAKGPVASRDEPDRATGKMVG